jgi:hypothetical protein
MKNKKWLAAALIAVMLTSGCGSKDTKSIVWHSSESSKIVKQIQSDTSLTKDQQEFFQSLAKSRDQKAYEGKTVGEILDVYAKWKAQVEKDREQMNQTLQVSVVDKVSLDQNASAGRMHPQIQFDISIANVSQNDIQTFKGRFIVSDASGNELFRADYLDTMPVMAGVTRTDTIYTDINDTNEKEVKAYDSPLSDLKVTWESTAMKFMDGTRIGEDKNELR